MLIDTIDNRYDNIQVHWLNDKGYPNSWLVYNGTSEHKMDDLGIPPILANLHIDNIDGILVGTVLVTIPN